jgi:hypothetical protein
MKELASWVMRGPWEAASVIVATTTLVLWLPVLSPLLFLSGAALALVTLRQGVTQGFQVLAIASVVSGVLVLLLFGSFMPVLWLILLYWLPSLGLAFILRATISLDKTIRLLSFTGMLAVVVFYWVLGPSAGWLSDTVTQTTQPWPVESGVDQAAMQQFLEVMETLLPGLLVSSLTLSLVLALLLARWWQALLYNPGGFRQEFHELRLGKILAAVMIVLSAVTLFSGSEMPLIANITLMMAMIYLIQGIALIHGIVAKLGLSPAWLIAFYILVIFVMSQLVMILAVIDAWVDFRNRIKPVSGNTR